jgi:hypothetical protein
VSRFEERINRHREEWAAEAAVEKALGGSQLIGGRSAPADARALRGIPMIGSECGGAIPGTVPHRNRRLDFWRPRHHGERP